MRCPNCHDTRILKTKDTYYCTTCSYTWPIPDVLDRLIDLHCRYEMLVGR